MNPMFAIECKSKEKISFVKSQSIHQYKIFIGFSFICIKFSELEGKNSPLEVQGQFMRQYFIY